MICLPLLAALTACGGYTPETSLVVAPLTAEVSPGDTLQFSAQPEADWSVQEAGGGSIDANGIYTAPALEGTFHVVASGKTVQVAPVSREVRVRRRTIEVSVSPTTISLAASQSATFAATVTGTTNTAVTWSVTEGAAGGTIAGGGVYTAPASAGTYHVAAASVANPSKTASATVTVTAPPPPPVAVVTVSVSPATASVAAGQSAVFAATVTGTTNTAVTWSVTEGATGGSIGASGLYTAPATAGTYHVAAASAADPTKTASATVTVTAAPPPPPPPSGVQFYVSQSGNDANAGTQAAPWRTIQKAMNSATAGSTVNIMAGTYFERLKMNVSGSASGGFITFQNNGYAATPGTPATVGGDVVVVDGTGANTGGDTLLDLTGRSYVRVQGLQFANLAMAFNGKAILVGGTSSYVQILNNKIHHIVANGSYSSQSSIYPFFAGGSGITNLTVSGNEIYDCLTGYSEAMTITGASNWLIANNYFHDLDAIVIDVGSTAGGPAANHGTVRANRIERLGPYSNFGLMSGENTSIKVGQAIYVQGGNHMVVERNTIANATYGINVTSETGYQPDDTITVRDNDVSGISNLSGAITVGEWSGESNTTSNVQVLNNNLHGNPFGFELLNATGVVVKNNVFSGNSTNVLNAYGASMTIDYNLYSGGGTASGDAHAVVAAPGFSSSVLVNAGDPAFVPGPSYDGVPEADYNGNPRVLGGRVDLGAIELQ